jgi:3-isopropylmalate/(R)-2-methylmalate dehydratase large subunit
MEGRMTVRNMSVEAGARTGIFAPDEKTYEFVKGAAEVPNRWDMGRSQRYWAKLHSDDAAEFDREVTLSVNELPPLVTWGTSLEQVVSITGPITSVPMHRLCSFVTV